MGIWGQPLTSSTVLWAILLRMNELRGTATSHSLLSFLPLEAHQIWVTGLPNGIEERQGKRSKRRGILPESKNGENAKAAFKENQRKHWPNKNGQNRMKWKGNGKMYILRVLHSLYSPYQPSLWPMEKPPSTQIACRGCHFLGSTFSNKRTPLAIPSIDPTFIYSFLAFGLIPFPFTFSFIPPF